MGQPGSGRQVRPEIWEEKSGFLRFLSLVNHEVGMFDEATGFGLRIIPSPPESIDGDRAVGRDTAFLIIRENRLLPERTYCLCSVLREKELYGYIGVFREGRVTVVREIGRISEFERGVPVLRDWLKELVRASCEKY